MIIPINAQHFEAGDGRKYDKKQNPPTSSVWNLFGLFTSDKFQPVPTLKTLNDGDKAIVTFVWSKCGWCERFIADIQNVIDQRTDYHVPFYIIESVETKENRPLASMFQIQSYPTVYFVEKKNGITYYKEYDGSREPEVFIPILQHFFYP